MAAVLHNPLAGTALPPGASNPALPRAARPGNTGPVSADLNSVFLAQRPALTSETAPILPLFIGVL